MLKMSEKKSKEKTKLEETVDQMQKIYPDTNIIMDLSGIEMLKSDFISTGCYGLDQALGGGLVRGRTVEIYGNVSGGKSTLTT